VGSHCCKICAWLKYQPLAIIRQTLTRLSRAHQAAPTLELGILWIPESRKNRGHPVSWAQAFMKQLEKFPVAEHDDYVDTFHAGNYLSQE